VGVTPLDMAHAYQTIANGGRLTTGTLTSYTCAGGGADYALPELQLSGQVCPGPVGIKEILQPGGPHNTFTVSKKNSTIKTAVDGYSYADDQTEVSMMRDVLGSIGTAASAAIPGVPAWGKTGTTSNYADAWFIGSIGGVHGMTVAVWVGYPNSNRSMAKGFGGKPVYGGTYPAEIWRNYVEAALNYYAHPNAASPTQTKVTSTGSSGASGPTGASASSATGAAGATPASQTGTATSPGGATTPSSGSTSPASTVTSGGGSTIPSTPSPPPATTTPGTTSGGGVTAPTGGAAAPLG